ncbi:radical SAM/SPASM domain-containing protein [Brevibacillus daliensis]|uniref:radical SAM/SPASM domain-containing protein n=1 Tax=Brevibacillus daliensis TaxID=2892995 RepID=UPI001E618389|nr:radical SAM protein [Brevibacillus daliensis]
MIGLSSLLETTTTFGDRLRYSATSKGQRTGTHAGHGPVIAWNITKTCNLHCKHCYANSEAKKYEGELSTEEALHVIDQFAEQKVPVILFSGGEPLIRPDIFELAERAIEHGIRVTFSTNGTLIDKEKAKRLKDLGISYVGISLDGMKETHDAFRQKEGAFDLALRGIRNCLEIGQKVGLRFTMNKHNIDELPDIFRLIEEENIPRICFYHLVYAGRGGVEDDISHSQTREALDYIIENIQRFHELGQPREILTVDNHADAIYLYLKTKETNPELAERIWEKMQRNGGNRSGIAICNVDNLGNVHPDQFSQQIHLGNLREQTFEEIWNSEHPILAGLRNRKDKIHGRCSSCQYFSVCNGNFRPRAQGFYGDYWASDPQCYLTDQEIGLIQHV